MGSAECQYHHCRHRKHVIHIKYAELLHCLSLNQCHGAFYHIQPHLITKCKLAETVATCWFLCMRPQLNGSRVSRLLPGPWKGRPRSPIYLYSPPLIRSPPQLPLWLHLEIQSVERGPVGRDRRAEEGQRHRSRKYAHEFFLSAFIACDNGISAAYSNMFPLSPSCAYVPKQSLIPVNRLSVIASELLNLRLCIGYGLVWSLTFWALESKVSFSV